MFDCIVIGGGVVGAFVARKLSSYNINILVIEKENDVGNGSSNANSAIVHSGYDPLPDTNKAKFNLLGVKAFPKICQELDVAFKQTGSLTVATEEEQLDTLKALFERGLARNLPVKLLSKEETLKLEPNLNNDLKGSLLVENAGIVDPFTLVIHAMENAVDNGVKLKLDEEVISIEMKESFFIVKTTKEIYETKTIINAAGIYSDKIHSLIEKIDYKITPRKGEYFVLNHFNKDFIKHVIFPMPSEKGKGILVTPTTSENYLVGPSSEWGNEKEDVSTDIATLNEIKKQALKLIPSIPFDQTIRTYSGNRSTPSTHDFIIEPAKISDSFINISGIESPGLTSAPAIADYVVDELLSKVLKLEKNPSFNPCVRPRLNPRTMNEDELNKIIKEKPEYGIVVCDCEKITLAEILDELTRSVPPTTIKGVKKRTRAGLGKCQGGFCQPLVLVFLARFLHKDVNQINYNKDNSNIVNFKTKGDNNV